MTFCALRVVAATALVVSLGCRADTATQEQPRPPRAQLGTSGTEPSDSPRANVVPESPADRDIRKQLSLALGRDSDLRDREISFIVNNGDINVTGTVRSEPERQRINDLAMGIPGVKSIANGLRVSP